MLIQDNNYTSIGKKNYTKIDGVKYAFKHIIRNYHSPRSNEKITLEQAMSRRPTFNKAPTSINVNLSFGRPMPELDLENIKGSPLIGAKDFNFGRISIAHKPEIVLEDENSISSEEDPETKYDLSEFGKITDKIHLSDLEEEMIFKFHYGVRIETPQAFKEKHKKVYDFPSLFYDISYPREKRLFMQRFSAVFTNASFDNVIVPEKSIIKKYMKEFLDTGTPLRNSSQRLLNRGQTNTPTMLNATLPALTILRNQIEQNLAEIKASFNLYCENRKG